MSLSVKKHRFRTVNEVNTANISNDVTCTYEYQEVSNTALDNFARPQALKGEIRSENRDQRKIFDPGFEPTSSGLDYRRSTDRATRPSWEQVVGIM